MTLAAFGLTALSIFVLFSVSPLVLGGIGFNYETPGGGAYEKIHPGTFLAAFALICRIAAARAPLLTAWKIFTASIGLTFFLGVWLALVTYAIVVLKIPFSPLIDTFLLPLIYAFLLRDMDERSARMLAYLVGGILAANAVIALAEYLTGWRLFTFEAPPGTTADPSRTDLVFDWRASLAMEWRATALLGHPLQNGMVIGGLIVALASPGANWIPPKIRWPLLGLEMLSMTAFGSRAALVMSLFIAFALLGLRLFLFLLRGDKLNLRAVALAIFCLPLAAIAGMVLNETGFFDRLIERFGSDAGSAQTRITMWELFRPIPFQDFLLGPDQDVVRTWQRMEGLEFGIESFWVGLPLTYGLLMSCLLFGGLAILTASIVRLTGRGTAITFLFFFLVASTSSSISGKTTALGMFVPIAFLLLRKNEAQNPPL